ncbi:MAG: hypothetical protein KDA53_10155 [Hyphomonas sp.]|nr:hypothetical protein [Hyphomonas sp.]
MSRSAIAIALACLVGLVIVLALAPRFWPGGGTDGISGHGWIAYIAGGVLTLALSGGLFFLSFHSSRSGFDDIDRPEDPSS